MTPTQEQIKADVCGLLPEQVFITNNSVPTMERYYWVDTEREITSREWLLVAHEAEKMLTQGLKSGYLQEMLKFQRGGMSIMHQIHLPVICATADQRLEAIHKVCFPEKWRGGA